MPKLRDFQQEDIRKLMSWGYRGLIASSMGTGKTVVTLGLLATAPFRTLPALIIAPASVTTNWKREAATWLPFARSHVIDDEKSPVPKNVDLIICSASLLSSRVSELSYRGIKTVVADECHFFKEPTSQRTQAFLKLVETIDQVLLLSGTPIINKVAEMDTLREALKLEPEEEMPIIRRLLEDVAKDVPPKERAYIRANLTPRTMKIYKEAEDNFSEWLKDYLGMEPDANTVDPSTEALQRMGYLRRIVGEGKIPAAVDFIDRAVRIGEPIVVFAEHQAVLDGIESGLHRQRIHLVRLDGNSSRSERQDAIDRFQKGLIPVFLASKAAKEGITLTRARHLLFVERWYTSAEEEQAEDRIRRIGQKYKTKIWFLHAEGTIDDRLVEIVDRKRGLIRTELGAALIAEKEEQTVAAMLSVWNQAARAPNMPAYGYGLKPLPSLPARRDVVSLLFTRDRFPHPKQAMGWAQMHDYNLRHVEPAMEGWRVWNRSGAKFEPGSFRSLPIAEGIRAIVGSRKRTTP